MIWLIISILSLLWVIVWTIIHASLFRQAIIYRCKVNGLPLWTLFLPMIVCAICFGLFINTLT